MSIELTPLQTAAGVGFGQGFAAPVLFYISVPQVESTGGRPAARALCGRELARADDNNPLERAVAQGD